MNSGNIDQAIKYLEAGKELILHDDVGSVAQSYVFTSAESVTEEKIAWLINHARGLLFVALSEKEATARGIGVLYTDANSGFRFGPSIESREGVRSGISALDRSITVKSFCEASIANKSIVSPGHVFPIISRKGGLLVSYGAPEAVTDLLKLSKSLEVGVIMHLLDEKGEHYSKEQLENLSKTNDMPIVNLSDVAKYLLINEPLVMKEATTNIPTKDFGGLVIHGFRSLHDQLEHIAFTYKQDNFKDNVVLTRMHSEKKLGDIFNMGPNGGREKLRSSLKQIQANDCGALVYIRKSNFKSSSEELAEKGIKKVKIQELRELGVGAQILQELGIQSIKLIGTSSSRLPDLTAFNISVVE